MAANSGPTRVLLIDDDEMSRELLVVLLEAEGCAVTSAESGDAALALLESSQRPHLVLTDMQMPGSTPEQLAGRLRRACGRRTLLIAISGSHPANATLAHFDGFLLKPFAATDVTAFLTAGKSPTRTKKPTAPSAAKKSATPRRAPAKKPSTTLKSLAASAAVRASNVRMDSGPLLSTDVASSPPVLDEAIYRQLASSIPAPQLHEMYAMCLNDARTRIDSMRVSAAAHDATQFIRQAHAIKGSCGMLGATELHSIASALEKNGLDPDESAVNPPAVAVNSHAVAVNSLDELSSACDRLERMLSSRA